MKKLFCEFALLMLWVLKARGIVEFMDAPVGNHAGLNPLPQSASLNQTFSSTVSQASFAERPPK